MKLQPLLVGVGIAMVVGNSPTNTGTGISCILLIVGAAFSSHTALGVSLTFVVPRSLSTADPLSP